MEFKKYSSLTNHYEQKFINKFLDKNPLLQHEIFIAREKLDGANIQLAFVPGQPMQVGKRTSYLNPGDDFYDIWITLTKYQKEFDDIQDEVDSSGKTLRFYGELYGPGINKRIDYGPEKKIVLFDLYKDGVLLTQQEFSAFMNIHNLTHLKPKLFKIGTLTECLSIDIEITPIIEGIVIQPYENNIFNQYERFIIKKKAKAFKDKELTVKDKVISEQNVRVASLNMNFRDYINTNRVLDVFSKHGPIKEQKQITEYLIYVLEDAKEDFLKINDVDGLTQKELKSVYNVGSKLVTILKEYL